MSDPQSRSGSTDRKPASSEQPENFVASQLSDAVHEFVRHAADEQSVRNLCIRACASLVKTGVFRAAWTGRLEPDGQTLRLLAIVGVPWEGSALCLNSTSTPQTWHQVARLGTALQGSETPDESWDTLAERFHFPSAWYFPISRQDRVRGILCAVPTDRDPTPDEHHLLGMVCSTLATHGERIMAERTMAAEKGLLRAVFESASYGLYYANTDGDVLLCNEAYLRLTGRGRADVIGLPFSVVTAQEHRALEMDAVGELEETGTPLEYVKNILRPNGLRIPVRVSVSPVTDTKGTKHGVLSLVRDTVAEVETARALWESESRHRAVFIHHPDSIFVLDHAATILDANPAAISLTRAPTENLSGAPIFRFIDAQSMDEFRQALKTLKARGNVHVEDIYVVDSTGQRIVTEVHGTRLDQSTVQVLVRDIRARREAERRLRELNNDLENQVAQRTRELVQLNEHLRRANKLKNAFLANMSHELRTPLNALLGLGEALLDGAFGEVEDQHKQILETMSDSGRHLLDLINEILDLSKIEAGQMELELQPFSVTQVCQASLRVIRPLALRKRIQHSLRIKPGFEVFTADERRLRQMLVNLLSNAVKFTPEGGMISLEASDDGDHAFFSVVDNGIGISAMDQRKIFEPFTQVDNSLSRDHQGTGLGLALVRKLAELHGGKVTVSSKPGEGSRFTVVLPTRPRV